MNSQFPYRKKTLWERALKKLEAVPGMLVILLFMAGFLVAILALLGYVMNIGEIVKLLLGNAQHFANTLPWIFELAIRVIGIVVAPLGAILGWF